MNKQDVSSQNQVFNTWAIQNLPTWVHLGWRSFLVLNSQNCLLMLHEMLTDNTIEVRPYDQIWYFFLELSWSQIWSSPVLLTWPQASIGFILGRKQRFWVCLFNLCDSHNMILREFLSPVGPNVVTCGFRTYNVLILVQEIVRKQQTCVSTEPLTERILFCQS